MQKNETRHYLTPLAKLACKGLNDLNINPDTFPWGKHSEKLPDIGLGNDLFLLCHQKSGKKSKVNK